MEGGEITGEVKTSRKAITSFVLAILSFIIPLLAFIAIPMGFAALGKIKKENLKGKGFAIAGIVIGFAAIVISLIAFILMLIVMNGFADNIENEWEADSTASANLEELCKEVKFEIVSVGTCAASSTSCEVVIKRLGGQIEPDKITVIVNDEASPGGSRLRWDYEGVFNVGETKTITVNNDMEKARLGGEASIVQVYVYVSDPELEEMNSLRETGCMSTEKEIAPTAQVN